MNLKSPSRQLRPRSAIGSRSKLIDREEVADEEEDEEEEEDTRDDHDEAANHIEFYDEGLERSDFLFQEGKALASRCGQQLSDTSKTSHIF